MKRDFVQDVTSIAHKYPAVLLERDPRDMAKDPCLLRLFALEEGFALGPLSENDKYARARFERDGVPFLGMSHPVTL